MSQLELPATSEVCLNVLQRVCRDRLCPVYPRGGVGELSRRSFQRYFSVDLLLVIQARVGELNAKEDRGEACDSSITLQYRRPDRATKVRLLVASSVPPPNLGDVLLSL
jgi:hypothetical protein